MSNVFSGKLTQSRGWTIGIGVAAAVLAAILLIVYLNRYRSSVNDTAAQTPVLVAKSLIPVGTSGTVVAEKKLYQVASYAQFQWTIRKTSTAKKTATTITPLLTDESRVEELALMLRGESRSETTRKEAAEMLHAATKLRAG